MLDTARKNDLLALLQPTGQTHLLDYWDELDRPGKASLEQQIKDVDFALIEQLYRSGLDNVDWQALAAKAKSPKALRRQDANDTSMSEEARKLGEQALHEGKVGVVLVAGGQGTRLKFSHPKGMFEIGPVSHHSLFEILLERIRAFAWRYESRIPLLVMTNQEMYQRTSDYLKDVNDRLGTNQFDNDDLHIFRQGNMPAVDAKSGKLLLTDKDSLALSPDGHGGMVAALQDNGLLEMLQQRGIEQLFYCQVDNPLTQVCDPLTVGYHLLTGSEMTTQVVAKAEPLERVGNVVDINGKTQIIEYSDLPKKFAEQRDASDNLSLWAGNLAVHVLDVAFLQRMAQSEESLPFHRAKKGVPYLDDEGSKIEPSAPNAIKFERFIFDLLPHAANAAVVEVLREEAFAPVKNSEEDSDTDTPTTARTLMVAQHCRWLEAAGATVADDIAVEISPLFALDAEELAGKIEPELHINKSKFFPAEP